MKTLLFALALITAPLLTSQAFAADTVEQPEGTMKLNQGDIEIGGEGNYYSINSGGWELNIAPKVEYFFLNRFSAGLKLDYRDGDVRQTSVGIGPAATYYFAIVRKTAFYVDQTLQWVNPEGVADNYFHGETGIGFDYFINPSVAFGPAMRGFYNFNGGQGLPSQGTNFRVAISVFF